MVSTKFKRIVTQKKGMGSVKQRSSVGEVGYSQTHRPECEQWITVPMEGNGRKRELRMLHQNHFPTLFLPWAEVAKIITWKLEPSVDSIS